MTKKVSLNQIVAFKMQAQKDLKNAKQTKFMYAVKRTLDKTNQSNPFKHYEERLSETNQQIADIQTKYQAVDQEGILLYKDEESKIRLFTPENEKLARKEIHALNVKWQNEMDKMFSETDTEIDPYVCPSDSIPKDLTFDQVDAYRGFVLPEDFEPTFED